jgi:hypothetical protein
MGKPAAKSAEELRALALNERARLYPWESFNQQELELMTGYPREAIRAAFKAPDFASQFGRSRPEDVHRWVRLQDNKIEAKAVR